MKAYEKFKQVFLFKRHAPLSNLSSMGWRLAGRSAGVRCIAPGDPFPPIFFHMNITSYIQVLDNFDDKAAIFLGPLSSHTLRSLAIS
jgi:hypothetical protein